MTVATTDAEPTFTRFTLSQRVEHLLVLVSVSMLCVTGLPQRFVDAAWAQRLIALMGGLDWIRWMHHVFGVMLLSEGVYHVIASLGELLFTRSKATAMFPRLRDFKDAIHQVAFLIGIRSEEPQFGRYDFRHKIEYWSLVWGMLLMGVTGLILLFPMNATRLVPGSIVTAARVAHSYEALLAFLAIVLWHFYNAHLAAESFPMDTSIFTGKISLARMRREHPLEYEQWVREHAPMTPEDGAREIAAGES
jgi:formate dehydrogenase subunit gamma